MKSVWWFHLYFQIDDVPINREAPVYDIFLYHGCMRSCQLRNQTDLVIKVFRPGFQNNKQLEINLSGNVLGFSNRQHFIDKTLMNRNPGELVRDHVARINLEDFLRKQSDTDKDSTFKIQVETRDLDGHKSDYILEGGSALNVTQGTAACERWPSIVPGE